MKESLLLLFVKHPVSGQVKTRLEAESNTETALNVYKALLDYTEKCVGKVPVTKRVYYGNIVPEKDLWKDKGYERRKQEGDTLGEKMSNAISDAQKEGYQKIILIGSDCAELTPEILLNAFDILKQKSVVLGPAADGGYYLIGMNEYFPFLFENKEWSTESVLSSTLTDLKERLISFGLLPILNDIDTLEDLIQCKNREFSRLFLKDE